MNKTPMILLSASPENGHMILKFYREQDGKIIRHDAGIYRHRVLVESGIGQAKLDLLTGETKRFTSVKPGTSIHEWERAVRPVDSFLYDNRLVPGRWYVLNHGPQLFSHGIRNEKLESVVKSTNPDMPDDTEYRQQMLDWAELLDEPIPDLRRVAFDIETEQNGDETRITAVGFSGSGIDLSMAVSPNGIPNNERKDLMIRTFKTEYDMIREAINVIMSYPVVLSWYGDGFDLHILNERAQKLRVPNRHTLKNIGDKKLDDGRTIHRIIIPNVIHIDLHAVFSNVSLQNYAFGGRYSTYGLGAVSQAMLGESKSGSGADVGTMSVSELATYCHNDARLTYKLSAYDDSIVMRLLIILSRITSLPIDRLSRSGISRWIISMMYRYMRNNSIVIPDMQYIMENKGVPQHDKYEGGLVLEPAYGIHWDVTVLDFASMYPGIIKQHNISWETVRCPHEECKNTMIPDTDNWRCTKRNGMLALMVGTLRELRVRYFKVLARDETLPDSVRSQYDTINQAIKVLMNASYGVMGSPVFDLYYLPVAESITAVGRGITSGSKKICEEEGIRVLGGDTDSLFVIGDHKPIQSIITRTKTLFGAELEIDKKFRYAIFSDRKKNYLGVDHTGHPIIKGLTGKKSHTPAYIARRFSSMIREISSMTTPADLDPLKSKLTEMVRHDINHIKHGNVAVDEMAFKMKVTKPVSEYGKSLPQHVRAAVKLLEKSGKDVSTGDVIAFVKTAGKEKAEPMEYASTSRIDRKKYVEYLSSTYNQILPPLGINTDDVAAGHRQDTLSSWCT